MDENLSALMAQAARDLHGRTDQATIERAAELAVAEIRGCDSATVSIVQRRGRISTLAATDDQARRGDEIQYEVKQGPCLDAIWDQRTVEIPVIAEVTDWPAWAALIAAETDFRSMLVFQLFTGRDTIGALSLYSCDRDGFDEDDCDYGAALAAHIAVAVNSAQQIRRLSNALDTRTTIGVAVGIIMATYELDQATAFGVLNRIASATETKVRALAAQIVESGQLPQLAEPEPPQTE